MPEPTDILVLCGGRSTRLGGIAKPLALFGGRPLIERVLERLPPSARLLISANELARDYRRYATRVIDDGRYAGRGPLAGICAGLAACSGDALLCVPGDAPLLPLDLWPRLQSARAAARCAVAHADDGSGPQPLCCLIAGDALADLQAYLDAGGSTPRDWFARAGAVAVPFADAPRWAWSVNTPEEWRAAEAQFAAATLAR